MQHIQLIIQASGHQKEFYKVKHTENIAKELTSQQLTKDDLEKILQVLIESVLILRKSFTESSLGNIRLKRLSFEANYINDGNTVSTFAEEEVLYKAMQYSAFDHLLIDYCNITAFDGVENYLTLFK